MTAEKFLQKYADMHMAKRMRDDLEILIEAAYIAGKKCPMMSKDAVNLRQERDMWKSESARLRELYLDLKFRMEGLEK